MGKVKQQVLLSKIHLPEGPLREVYHAYELIDYLSAPTNWIEASSVSRLINLHPITVRAVDRHFEVVGGFRSFQIASSLCPSTHSLEVMLSQDNDLILVQDAVFELVSCHLLYTSGGSGMARQLYLVLKKLRQSQYQEFKQVLPVLRSISDLKSALNLTSDQTKSPKLRHSPLKKAIEKIK
tara:strand:- start:5603 stop:6145 length:543 start_codon:yes stop_codon:yes gene_type:complete